ncbi:hypothetical protein BU26DRAFT_329897 [Trematosphaeria pertusa]|uniref:SAP domain-containing protein n=1 Tax=Trematosphaeria pertusa TaxID=390896 RepID=A0A6A6ICX1_9PLEO|nr:uncharacterized protein BU26DRAFT_329897 [Trematosphaeria pertusa]KAF2248241.1 hypothetical protein BU26DRAFT_329897 [Trematosphaeria pertusa]
MTDYNKQTVANLRHLLKDRAIPSTGLTRKAQIIEKLEQWDNRAENAPAAESQVVKDGAQPRDEEEVQQQEKPGEGGSAVGTGVNEGSEADVNTEPVTSKLPAAEPTPAPEQSDDAPPPTALAPDATMAERSTDKAETPVEASVPQPTEEVAPAAPAPDEQPVPQVSEPTPEPAAEPTRADLEPATGDATMPDRTPSPSPDEKQSIEKPDLLPIPEERSATTTADPSRFNSEELAAETRKRKRRSLTPDLPSQDIRAKKARPSVEAPEVHLKEDEDVVMEQRRPEDEAEQEKAEVTKAEGANGASMGEVKEQEAEAAPGKEAAPTDTKSPAPQEPEKRPVHEKKEKAPRYRELFQPAAATTPTEAIIDDRPIVPALHPATPALYIRNFMRPLRPEPLRTHLVSLASPPSGSPDPTLVKALFLDAMKTHALVLLANTTAASRVRASFHGSIWPPEGNRKELWVDFIPEDRVEDWIKQEEDAIRDEKESRAAGRPIPAKKFEVVYPEDENGGIEAVFQEVGASAIPFNPPKGPRLTTTSTPQYNAPPTQSLPTPTTSKETRQDIEKSFKTLDELFLSTATKPKLYYLPVSDSRADDRLKELNLETSRDWTPEERRKGRGMQGSRLDQKVRFGFDEEDRVVEVGGDFGPWTEEFSGGRGGRGGYRGRGGWGGRGGGGGWRSGN